MPTSPFTPEQISQILEEFFKTVGTRQYIGARYVPIFGRKGEESIQWDNTAPYEPLTIVLYQGNSYTSRQYVPTGVEITNQEFWALTGNYNAQVEAYRQEAERAVEVAQESADTATAARDAIDNFTAILPSDEFSADNTVKDYVDTAIDTVDAAIDTAIANPDNRREFFPQASPVPYSQFKHGTGHTVQGFCIVNGNYCFGAMHTGGNSTIPAEVYLNSMLTNANIASNNDNLFGHCNDLTYNPSTNRIIVFGTDIGDNSRLRIYEMDANTLQIMETYVPEVNVFSGAYDAERNCYYTLGNGHFYTMDAEFNIVSQIPVDLVSQTVQGVCYRNDYLYVLNMTSLSIDVHSIVDYSMIQKIPILINDGVVEVESIDFYNDTLYIGAGANCEPYFCLFECSIEKKQARYLNHPQGDHTLYVEYTSSAVGNGLSANSAAACLSAVDALPFDTVNINITGATAFTKYYVFPRRKQLTLRGTNVVFPYLVAAYYYNAIIIVGCTFSVGMNVNRCLDAQFNNCVFNQGTSSQYSLDVTGSNVILNTCTFNDSYPVNSTDSAIDVNNCTFNASSGVNQSTTLYRATPYKRLYNASASAASMNMPFVKLYHAFVIVIHDGSDGGTLPCIGYIDPSSPNRIYFSGCMTPGSSSLRYASGYLDITNNQTVVITRATYVKNSNVDTNYYISQIYGIA